MVGWRYHRGSAVQGTAQAEWEEAGARRLARVEARVAVEVGWADPE